MKASHLSLLALFTFGLVGYAVYTLTSAQPVQPRARESAAASVRGRPAEDVPAAQGDTPLTRIARAVQEEARTPQMPARRDRDRGDEEPTLEEVDESPEAEMPITRAAAEATFDSLLTRLEEIEPAQLAERERDDLYRNVNDAFTALSARVGDDDIELLEDSYQRMQAQLSRLKIKPSRFEVRPNDDPAPWP